MNNESKQERILMSNWGEHHWFMLFLIEDWCVWADGKVGRPSTMRTNPNTHPKMLDIGSQVLADTQRKNGEEPVFPPEDFTKLHDGSVVEGHDSWDCIDDLIAYQLVSVSLGEDGKPTFELTEDGWAYATRVRQHFAENKKIDGYNPADHSAAARHRGWGLSLIGCAKDGSDDLAYEVGGAVLAYEDGGRRTKVKLEDGYLSVGENSGDFTEDSWNVPTSVLLNMLEHVGCSPVQFTKASLQSAKQECVDIKLKHLALCENDSDEASAAQAAQECEEAIQALIDKCETDPPKKFVVANDPWCDGCVHQLGSLFAPCSNCRRVETVSMLGRTKYSSSGISSR